MPGRFALTYPKVHIEQYFNIEIPQDLRPRYNISPTQNCLILCTQDKIPELMHWGYSPFWNKDQKFRELINARSESVQEKPMFRKAFKDHRCVVIASGYYEWQEKMIDNKITKVPFYISYKDNQPLTLAAIWDRCQKADGTIQTGFCFLTTEPNTFVKKYHERMPVVINNEKLALWLDPNTPSIQLETLLKPAPASHFKAQAASTMVNNPRNDKPGCLEKPKRLKR